MFVCRACYVGRGLCDELITHSEESYRAYVFVKLCDLETSKFRLGHGCSSVQHVM